ncbi:MAG: DUF6065 family protein [Bacteroidota bacterium]
MSQEIIANYLDGADNRYFDIVPLTMQRDWMHKSKEKFVYKCLPLGIANQYGWAVASPVDFTVSWYGGREHNDVEIYSDDPNFDSERFVAHFGEATFTLLLDFLIQTPENYSIYIRGIPNQDYGILKPLDAIVETDWLPFTFTYNFKFMEPGTVDFKKGDPLFCFFPIERNTVENFTLKAKSLVDNVELNKDFEEYAKARDVLVHTYSEKMLFQKFYIDGKGPNKIYKIKNHLKRVFFKNMDM